MEFNTAGGGKLNQYTELIKAALAEDLAGGEDVTSMATLTGNEKVVAEFINRKPGVIAGVGVVQEVLEYLGITDIEILVGDGSKVEAGTVILRARGNTRALLLAERTALNFLSHLSGIATLTRAWVDAVAGTSTKIRDTRKTTPGLRKLEKYAVLMGGGTNHRLSLSQSALIKDNHVEAAGGVTQAFNSVRGKYPDIEIEIEVDTFEQLNEALSLNPDLILLDNMSPEQCQQAVSLSGGKVKLEASGGLTLENAKKYAETGVDFLAVGALTHSAPVLDIGLDLKAEI
ncbi:MAG: carboxylating nicotinate-nucleotide diphosphorylase [Actinobacteria bacterium]|uniref:Probable nicotinate-nucleotide pyrophosphorylase [carboxylating] n=1 Tax=freshwater metagenome TaxID=449393 RepID=A0A6J6T199_9ZZZZ|nr:carboxylating nicotinate-nucleotide diphosphorylase [Actinomycetota bacterium]MSW47361.1 carboxylating nicotinate-nucleotide diphosphorylase [Actinomycetota bacterium]MSX24782.1 carboxylating nicotinate-nucleotide diphosphorylase [Actinomycetota bacterium]MSY46188.1 carboxylating nicotinate-nucleotide diphosphorylase [Actinomycetota bacterium]MSY56810.1 carboxylating nicotinate-nucleotide diphosphorylase [Actinomycetota bacterium]